MNRYINTLAATAMLTAAMRSAEDPLADLGLDLGNAGGTAVEGTDGAPVPAEASGAEAAVAAATEAKDKRKEVEIADLEFGFVDLIPQMKRGGATGSKYEFDKLVAPVAKEDGSGFKYAMFVAKLANPEDDAAALKRSVQSATTAENKSHKDAGTPNRYITRTHVVNGEFAGVAVFRVDATLDVENDKG